jgi:hypothetical protein
MQGCKRLNFKPRQSGEIKIPEFGNCCLNYELQGAHSTTWSSGFAEKYFEKNFCYMQPF